MSYLGENYICWIRNEHPSAVIYWRDKIWMVVIKSHELMNEFVPEEKHTILHLKHFYLV